MLRRYIHLPRVHLPASDVRAQSRRESQPEEGVELVGVCFQKVGGVGVKCELQSRIR